MVPLCNNAYFDVIGGGNDFSLSCHADASMSVFKSYFFPAGFNACVSMPALMSEESELKKDPKSMFHLHRAAK